MAKTIKGKAKKPEKVEQLSVSEYSDALRHIFDERRKEEQKIASRVAADLPAAIEVLSTNFTNEQLMDVFEQSFYGPDYLRTSREEYKAAIREEIFRRMSVKKD